MKTFILDMQTIDFYFSVSQLQKYTASYLFTVYLHTNEVFPTISLSCIDTSLNTQTQACTQMVSVSQPFL